MIDLEKWIDSVTEKSPATLRSDQYELLVDSPIVSVRNVETGALEAYSSSKSDFRLSLEEFVYDFFAAEE